jgi:hypothetical protein
MNAKHQLAAAGVVVLLIAVVAAVSWGDRGARPVSSPLAAEVEVSVTSSDDVGPGSLREALYIAGSAKGHASVLIVARKVIVRTPLPPLMNPHGIRLLAQPPGAEIDARSLAGGAVLDVVGADTAVEGLVVRNCPAAGVLLRATHFHLRASTIESCDVGVEVAANAGDLLLDANRFAMDRIGVRFAAPNQDAAVVGNDFEQSTAAGMWAVRGADAGTTDAVIRVRDNRFTGNHSGMVVGNIPVAVEHNEFAGNAPDAAVHLVGAGAVIRDNRIRGAAPLGIVAENARAARIEGNELSGFSSLAVLLRSCAGAVVHANRIADSSSGMAFVLGDPEHPSSVTGNTISDPRLDGIDVIGDSPILRDNQVVRPHALALRVTDYAQAGGQSLRAHPTLEGNNFRANTIGTLPVAATAVATAGQP